MCLRRLLQGINCIACDKASERMFANGIDDQGMQCNAEAVVVVTCDRHDKRRGRDFFGR